VPKMSEVPKVPQMPRVPEGKIKAPSDFMAATRRNPSLEAVRQPKIPLPLEGERQGEGVRIQVLTPSPRPLVASGAAEGG
jgi:hypothetical protein